MTEIEVQAHNKISELLNSVYEKLSKYSQMPDEERQLLPSEEQLMQNLNTSSFEYQSLLRILAIDSYSSVIVSQSFLCDELCGILTASLQHVNALGELLKKGPERKDTFQEFNRLSDCVTAGVKISQELFPKNSYVEDQNKLLQSADLAKKIEDSVLAKLTIENQDLARKCKLNEVQIYTMEEKLTKLLREHSESEKDTGITNKMSNIELREELMLRNAEIHRMNEEFSFEIEKYNSVFEALKAELEEMKGYQNMDLIDQIQMLETEIVRLRQEGERDQIIIRQLRSDNTVFSSMGSNGYHSPHDSNARFHASRYDY